MAQAKVDGYIITYTNGYGEEETHTVKREVLDEVLNIKVESSGNDIFIEKELWPLLRDAIQDLFDKEES